MRTAWKVFRFEAADLFRSKLVLFYFLFFYAATDLLFRFGESGPRVSVSIMSLMLFIVPLVAILFGSLTIYHAREFVQLLLAQPVGRKSLFAGLYFGLTAPLCAGYAAGVTLPFLLFSGLEKPAGLATLVFCGVLLTAVFTALAFWIAFRFDDRTKGFAAATVVWIFLAVLFDSLVLFLAFAFADYPLETPMLVLSFLNPIDLVRTILLLQSDLSALLGYTGALFDRFLTSSAGLAAAFAALAFWILMPFAAGMRRFLKKDF